MAEPIAKANARLGELERLEREGRARQTVAELRGLTTADIARLPARDLENMYRALDPDWEKFATPATEGLRRLTPRYYERRLGRTRPAPHAAREDL